MCLSYLTILILAAVMLAAGAYLGVLLGRRSTTANETVDRIRERYDQQVAELREQVRAQQRRDKTAPP